MLARDVQVATTVAQELFQFGKKFAKFAVIITIAIKTKNKNRNVNKHQINHYDSNGSDDDRFGIGS